MKWKMENKLIKNDRRQKIYIDYYMRHDIEYES